MADPLTGKFFFTYHSQKPDLPFRELSSLGQVRTRVRDGLYLVKHVNALTFFLTGIVEFNKQVMVSLDEMRDWEFFDSPEAWRDAYNAYDQRDKDYRRAMKDSPR
jgi:hypothetical protein